jgi:hypothetical protein
MPTLSIRLTVMVSPRRADVSGLPKRRERAGHFARKPLPAKARSAPGRDYLLAVEPDN